MSVPYVVTINNQKFGVPDDALRNGYDTDVKRVIEMPGRLFLLGLFVSLTVVVTTTRSGSTKPMVACERPLTIRASEAYEPFSIKDVNGTAVGIDNLFMARVMDAIGCKFRFVFRPWKRSLLEVREGEIDILPSASLTQERLEYALFSAPYRNDVTGFVVRHGDVRAFNVTSLDDVVKYDLRIGRVRSAYRGEVFERFLARPDSAKYVVDYSIAPHGLNLLVNGRIDMMLGMPLASIAQAEKMGVGDLVEIHPFMLGKEPVRLMYSRKTIAPELVRLLDAAIKQEVSSARYQQLYGPQAIETQ